MKNLFIFIISTTLFACAIVAGGQNADIFQDDNGQGSAGFNLFMDDNGQGSAGFNLFMDDNGQGSAGLKI